MDFSVLRIATGANLFRAKLFNVAPAFWGAGAFVAVVETVIGDRFLYLWALLAFTNIADWFAGRWAVRLTDPKAFSRARSRIGIYSKSLGLLIVGILRLLEAIIPPAIQAPSTRGYIASAVVVALILDEVDSIDSHRQTMGQRPIPLLSWAIKKLRAATGGDRRMKARAERRDADAKAEKEAGP